MIIKILLNTEMACKTFVKILKNTIQVKKSKTIIVFGDIIADMFNKEN